MPLPDNRSAVHVERQPAIAISDPDNNGGAYAIDDQRNMEKPTHERATHRVAGHSHGQSHGPPQWWDFPLDHAGRRLAVAAIAALLVALVGTIVLWPSGDQEVPDILTNIGIERRTAEVIEVTTGDCYGTRSEVVWNTVTFRLDDGTVGTYVLTLSAFVSPAEVGDKVIVADQEGLDVDEQFRYYFLDFHRTTPLLQLAGIFALAVVILGRMQGFRSLIALGASFVILAYFTLPALLETITPVLVAIVGSAGVAAVTFHLTHGVTRSPRCRSWDPCRVCRSPGCWRGFSPRPRISPAFPVRIRFT